MTKERRLNRFRREKVNRSAPVTNERAALIHDGFPHYVLGTFLTPFSGGI